MISGKMQEAINQQINAELYSSYLYMSMAAYFEHLQLPGFCHWMKVQAQEELAHAVRFYNYLSERGGRALMAAIEAPPTEWESPRECMQAVLDHERKVTGLINQLMNLAQDERDHASMSFLQWFVDEQVEEEASVDAILGKLNLIQSAPGGLFMLDNEMGSRSFTMPVDLKL